MNNSNSTTGGVLETGVLLSWKHERTNKTEGEEEEAV